MKNLKSKKSVIIFLSLVLLFTVFTEASAITVTVEIKGKGGAVVDTKSGKATVCPESANTACATISVDLGYQVTISDKLNRGNLALNRYALNDQIDWTNAQGILYVEKTGEFVEVEITNATEVDLNLEWNEATLQNVKVRTFK
jgi:hypothetical protein